MMNRVISNLLLGVLGGFKNKNLNPLKTPSTGLTYASVGVIGASAAMPVSEYDALIQASAALVGIYCFYRNSGEK